MKARVIASMYVGVFLILFSQTALALDEAISSWAENQWYPAISGKNVVWEDYYSGSHYDIYLYDLEAHYERSICLKAGNQRRPDIDGNIIVWEDDRNGNGDIYGYDLAAEQEFKICTNEFNQGYPKVSGHIVVWEDQRNGNYDIFGYNLDTQTEFEICTDTNAQWYPDVSVTESYAPYVVWQDNRNGNWDLYYFNVNTSYEGDLITHSAAQERPRIDMPRVVWQDDRNGNWDIYMFTFFTLPPGISVIENDAANQQYPVISGKNIVWQDYRNGNWDIYGGRLGVLGAFQICVDTATQAYPAVSDNYIVWHDYRNGATNDYDVYGGAIGADSWHACSTLLDFEFVHEYLWPDWNKISNHYEGVTFSSSRAGCTGDTVIIVDMTGANGTHSGRLAIGNYGCEFVDGFLQMVFDDPQNKVLFYVGSYCGNYTIRAYDDPSGGNLVHSQGFTLPCDLTEHGVHRFVEVVSEEKNIYRIEIANDWGIHVRIDDLEFNIDDTPPTASIEHPEFEECTCDVFPIVGEACDEDRDWVDYTLKYQPTGAAPDDWTVILAARGQVCGAGILAEWDTSGLPHGRYYLKLEATNECGLAAADTTVAFVDKLYNNVTIRYPDNYDGTNGVMRGNSVCIDGTVWDFLCYDNINGYTAEYRPLGSGPWQSILPGPVGTAYVLNDPYARWDTTAVPDGDYEVRVSATDHCGNTATDIVTPRVDNTPPVAEIMDPVNCVLVPSGIIPVIGTAFDANLNNWTLQYTGGTANDWVTIASGNSPVVDGLLGNWDTSGLIPCSYTIRLRVWDQALLNCTGENRNYSEFTVSVKLGADLNGDGCINLDDFAIFASLWLTGCP